MPSIGSFSSQEVEILAVALRYWRSRRGEGQTRRGDPPLGLDTLDQLLAKLGSAPPRIPRTPSGPLGTPPR